MKITWPGLMLLALAAWGWFAAWLPLGLLLALVVSLPQITGLHRNFSERELSRVVDSCTVLALLTLVYFASTVGFPKAIYQWLRYAPLWLLALPLCQGLHGAALPLSAFLMSQRGRPQRDMEPLPLFDTQAPYVLTCLISTASIEPKQAWLYPCLGLLLGLWLHRLPGTASRRRQRWALLLLALGVGWSVHRGIDHLHGYVEEWGTELMTQWLQGDSDPFRSQTRMGDLGKVKLDDHIVLRVRPVGPAQALLLRDAVYDTYLNGEWLVRDRQFHPVHTHAGVWRVAPGPGSRQLNLSLSLARGRGLIPVPAGTTTLSNLDAADLAQLAVGTLRTEQAAPKQWLQVQYRPELTGSAPPQSHDLQVPAELQPVLQKVVAPWQNLTPAAQVAALQQYFAQHFRYSLYLGQGRSLSRFLLQDRQGHCVYFASATVLLLRMQGIPARYVTGYSVQEYSSLEHGFVVRGRHAHAWAMAYVQGQWRELDTTPARWADDEAAASLSWYQPLLDGWSWLKFEWDRMAWGSHVGLAGLGLVLLLSLALLWRMLARVQRRQHQRQIRRQLNAMDAAWQQLEQRLSPLPRPPEHTPQSWLQSLGCTDPELMALLARYYRLKFDPLAAAQPTQLQAWLRDCARWRPVNKHETQKNTNKTT